MPSTRSERSVEFSGDSVDLRPTDTTNLPASAIQRHGAHNTGLGLLGVVHGQRTVVVIDISVKWRTVWMQSSRIIRTDGVANMKEYQTPPSMSH